MLNYANEIVIEEKMNNMAKGIFHSPSFYRWSKHHDPLSNGKIEIVRNLEADSFNIEYEKFGMGPIDFYPYANMAVNGNKQADYNLSSFGNNTNSGHIIKIHRSAFNDNKLHDVSTMTLGFNIGDSPNPTDGYVLSRYIFEPKFLLSQKHIDSTFDKVIHFKTIKTIVFQKHHLYKHTMSKVNDYAKDNDVVDISYTYNHLYLVPTQLKRLSANESLFDIYMSNDENRDMKNDRRIISTKMKSTTTGSSSMNTQFVSDGGKNIVPSNGKSAELIGHIKLIDSSYYNYETSKTVIGNNEFAQIGELVPYSFKGNYTRSLDLSLNDTFKKIQINLAQNINQPILDESEGIVRLGLQEVSGKNISMFLLDQEGINTIKKQKLSLEGIARVSYAPNN